MPLTKVKSGGVSDSITLTSPDINAPDIDGGTIDNAVIGGSTAAAGTFTTITSTGGSSSNWNTAYGWGDHSTQSYATQTYVGTAVSNLVDSSPAALDTLNELAAALGDDPNFATTVTNSIALKAPLASPSFTGTATMDGLTVAGANGNLVLGTSGNDITFNRNADNYITASGGTSSNIVINPQNRFVVNTGNTERLRIDSAGRVGIGTSSPASPTGFGSSGILHLKGGTGNDCSIVLEGLSGSGGRQEIGASGGALQFYRGAATGSMTESMRIDASGNLLVGTTDTTLYNNTSGSGTMVNSFGRLDITRDDVMAIFNRNTSDGEMINFRKDGTTVGSIGTEGGDLAIGNADTGLQFVNTSQIIRPQNLTTNSAVDAQVSLGQSAYRFKDLYLSGKVQAQYIYRSGADGSGLHFTTNAIYPTNENAGISDGTETLGASGARFKDLYLSGIANIGTYLRFGGASNYYVHSDNANYLRFGTAGTERMRIGSSGQVKIANGGSLNFDAAANGNYDIAYKASDNTFNIIANSSSAAMGFHTSSTERMRISSAGAISVGSSTQAVTEIQLNHENSGGKGEIQLNSHGTASFSMLSNFTGSTISGVPTGGFGLITPHNYRISISTNGLERMRISASGHIGVFGSGATNERGDIAMTSGTGVSTRRWGFGGGTGSNSSVFYIINEGNVGQYMAHGSQSWTSHSDERIKENITDVGTVLPSLMNMRCVKYNLISNPTDTKIGFIAQDWELAFPEVVDENEHLVLEADGTIGTDENSDSTTPVKAMAYTETLPLLLKAIQEQQTLIESLTARIAALEA